MVFGPLENPFAEGSSEESHSSEVSILKPSLQDCFERFNSLERQMKGIKPEIRKKIKDLEKLVE